MTWVRRSRDGFAWRDGVEVPIAEEREAYRVELSVGGDQTSEEVLENAFMLPADFAPAGTMVTIALRQVGRAGLSDPAMIACQI